MLTNAVSPSSDFVSRFESACARLLAVMDDARPVVSTEFSRLPFEEQERVLRMVEGTVTCAEAMVLEGASPFDSGALSWRVLSYMGFRPNSSAYTLYTAGDVIEVYNSAHKLIFASLNFLKLSAYSLDTLYSRPWTELWERAPSTVGVLWQSMVALLEDPSRGTIVLSLAPDIATEVLTGRQGLVRTRGFSAISEPRGGCAILCVNELIRVLPTA